MHLHNLDYHENLRPGYLSASDFTLTASSSQKSSIRTILSYLVPSDGKALEHPSTSQISPRPAVMGLLVNFH